MNAREKNLLIVALFVSAGAGALYFGYLRVPPPSATEAAKAAKEIAPPKAAVTVLATAKVAGYDAVVLEASDAMALHTWLKERD